MISLNLIKENFGIETVIPSKGDNFMMNAKNLIECLEAPVVKNNYKRLAVIEMMDKLKEEMEEMTEILKTDLKEDKEDFEVEQLQIKIKNLEKVMVELLK